MRDAIPPAPAKPRDCAADITIEEWERHYLGEWDFGGFGGPVVLPQHIDELVMRRVPAWIVVETLDGPDDDLAVDPNLAIAAQEATHVFIVPDLDDAHEIAGALAIGGGRVLLIERRNDAPLPVLRGRELTRRREPPLRLLPRRR
jgi:hypothetical protein